MNKLEKKSKCFNYFFSVDQYRKLIFCKTKTKQQASHPPQKKRRERKQVINKTNYKLNKIKLVG
jgi:hypothetical protein